MAITFIEGFDTYNGDGAATATTVGLAVRWVAGIRANISSSTPYGSGQSLSISYGSTGSSRNAYTSIPTSSSGAIGFAFYMTGLPSTFVDLATFFPNSASPGGRQCAIGVTSAGALFLGTGGSTGSVPVYTTINTLTPAAWNYIECEFTISNTVGTVNFYVNGALFGSATGLDTQTQAGSTFNVLMFGTLEGTGFGFSGYFDNVYLTDTPTRLGEQRVATVVPTSDGTPSQWAASGGAVAPFTMVDEVLCNADVDYIFDGTVNDRAVFNMASTGATPVSVSAVQIGTYSRKTDSGSRAIQLEYVDSGGTAYPSSDFNLGSTYVRQLNILETNPSTATAWTPAEANALKTGVKVSV
jgi:hypothetical protein